MSTTPKNRILGMAAGLGLVAAGVMVAPVASASSGDPGLYTVGTEGPFDTRDECNMRRNIQSTGTTHVLGECFLQLGWPETTSLRPGFHYAVLAPR